MKFVLVVIGKKNEQAEVIDQFKAAHPLSADDTFVKILIGPDRLVQGHLADDPEGWHVETPEQWRLVGEEEYSPLETYIRRRMKGGEVEVHFINLDREARRRHAVSSELSGLGWRPFKIQTPVAH